MESVLYLIGALIFIYYFWLNILATIAVRYDRTLDVLQKNSQTVFLWLVPIFGGVIVLHLVWDHYPDAIPKSWIPWPFKKIIYGKSQPTNRNRNDNEYLEEGSSISRHNRSRDNNSEGSDSVGDGGGD